MLPRKMRCSLYIMAAIAGVLFLYPEQFSAASIDGVTAEKISVQDAYEKVKSGKALLVCAYEKEQACSDIMLEGAITLKAFEEKLPELKRDQPIIFYCQ